MKTSEADGVPLDPPPGDAPAARPERVVRRDRRKDRGKLTPAVHKAIVEGVRGGNFPSVAARACGIKPARLGVWLRRGMEEESGIYRKLYDDVMQAEAEDEMVHVAKARQCESAKDARDYLEKRYPKRWGKKEKIESISHEERKVIIVLPDNGRGDAPPPGTPAKAAAREGIEDRSAAGAAVQVPGQQG